LAAGALMIAWWAGAWFAARVYQDYQNHQLNRTLRSGPSAAVGRASTGNILGRLEIPRLGISVLVLNGVDAASLLLGAGHIPGTSGVAGVGNLAIAAHRDTFFRPLREIRKDDQIEVTTPRGTYPYVVEWTRVVDPNDIDALAATPEPSLTLITCYPFGYVGPAPRRFVVRARFVAGTGPVPPADAPHRDARPSPFAKQRRVIQAAALTATTSGEAEQVSIGDDGANAAATQVAAASPVPPAVPESETPAPPAAASEARPAHARRGISRLNPVRLFRKIAASVHGGKTEAIPGTVADANGEREP